MFDAGGFVYFLTDSMHFSTTSSAGPGAHIEILVCQWHSATGFGVSSHGCFCFGT